jgi:hypothetical protein
MSHYARNEVVRWLLAHAYGQGGTVAVPTSGTPGPLLLGAFPAGVEDVLEHITTRHTAWSPTVGEIDWCFLVGGPGNGKSEALRSLAARLGISLPPRVPGRPVPRTVPIDWPLNGYSLSSGLQIAFVNDASIPSQDSVGDGSTPGSLFFDIATALGHTLGGTPTSLFVNVNRGIVIEERAALRAVADWSTESIQRRLAAAAIHWLANPSDNLGGLEDVLRPTPERPQYGEFRVRLSPNTEHPIVVCVRVVFLDMLSLLEPTPGAGDTVVNLSRVPPEVAQYLTLGRLVSPDITRDITVAGGLVMRYSESQRWEDSGCRDAASGELCSAHGLCPFAQNALWLREPALRQRVLDALRAAEIAAGRRLTYRDLLGHVSLLVLGTPEESWLGGTHPCQWVADNHQRLGSGTGPKATIVALARHRIYTNIYPGGGFIVTRVVANTRLKEDSVFSAIIDALLPGGESARVQPFENAFADIDPARDTESWSGLRKRVMDTVESLDIVSPAEQLTAWSEIPQAASSEIEMQLDRVLREEIAVELPKGTRAAVSRVRVIRRWRAVMLLRHVGAVLGQVRYAKAIGAWLAEQASALLGGQRLRLGDGINNLIIPAAAAGRKVFTPPLRPRTYCLTGNLPRETLLVTVQANELELLIVPHGDALVAEVRMRQRGQPTEALATLAIDLAVAREALLHADGNTDAFTEIGDTAFARIERARASLISRGRLRRINAWFTDEKGEPFQLVPSPTGPSALRVQPG